MEDVIIAHWFMQLSSDLMNSDYMKTHLWNVHNLAFDNAATATLSARQPLKCRFYVKIINGQGFRANSLFVVHTIHSDHEHATLCN